MDAFDPDLWRIVWLWLGVSGTALLMSALIGVPLGAWLGLSRFPGRFLVSTIIHAGMGLPPVIIGLVIYMLLSRSGPLAFLEWLFTPQAMILAFPAVIGIIKEFDQEGVTRA